MYEVVASLEFNLLNKHDIMSVSLTSSIGSSDNISRFCKIKENASESKVKEGR